MLKIFETNDDYNIKTLNNTSLVSGKLYYVKEDNTAHFYTNNIEGGEAKIYDLGGGGDKYVVLKYNIDTAGNIQIISNIKDPFSLGNKKYCDEIIIDGEKQDNITDTYTLSVGEHIIKIHMVDDTIGKEMFSNISCLKEVYIPQNITKIKQSAFDSCSNLKNINFSPESKLNSCGNLIFSTCAIESITIPNTLTNLSTGFLKSCPLTNIVINDNVKIIGQNCFNTCTSLKTLIIGSGVTNINSQAFRNTSALTTIIVKPITPPTLSYDAFNGTVSSCPIYVPSESVSAYKSAQGWSDYASRIQAIPS